MKYDFDKPTDRRNTGSLKWDISDDELPMWVADMDFETAPEIRDDILKRANHGIFGYSIVPEEWYNAYTSWWKKRHGFELRKECLIFCTGVVPAISSAVRKLTTPGEKIVVQTPVYNIFFNSILNNGRVPLENRLIYDGDNYSMDFADLESKLSDPQTTMMILCNPQNPCGKIWEKETLAKVGRLCRKHGVTVISDEIHCDITDVGKEYIPFAAADDACREISLTCFAPTKAFNIAGMQSAAVYTENTYLYNKINRALNTDEVAEPNSFAVVAAISAFTKGQGWLDALREYIGENKRIVYSFIDMNIPEIKVLRSDATYLLWLDCSAVSSDSSSLCGYIRKKTGLYLSSGNVFGSNGNSFLRMNIACRRSGVHDGLQRLKKAIGMYISENQ